MRGHASTEQNDDRIHRLMQDKHQLQAALREALRWIAHQHSSSANHEQKARGSKVVDVVKAILSQHHISESEVEYLLGFGWTNNVQPSDEETLIALLKSMIRKIQQSPPCQGALDHTPHLLQTTTQLQHQAIHLWRLNAQLWEENQRLSVAAEQTECDEHSSTRRPFDGSTPNCKLHQLIREKTQLIEQLTHLQRLDDRHCPTDDESGHHMHYLRAENLSLLRRFHEAKTRATQLEQVLNLNREAWVCTSDHLPTSSDIYWISDGESIWRSFFNTNLEAFEDSPGGLLPAFWMPIMKPCPPFQTIRH